MALTIFMIPSVRPEDRGAVWQLQLLAQGQGIVVRTANRTKHLEISAADRGAIRDSDAVVAFVTGPLDAHALAELAAAHKLKKPVLALVEDGVKHSTIPAWVKPVGFQRGMSLADLGQKIRGYVHKVAKGKVSKESDAALWWVLGIGVGILALSNLAKES